MMSTHQETILAVDGMTCSSCIRHVEGALRKLDAGYASRTTGA